MTASLPGRAAKRRPRRLARPFYADGTSGTQQRFTHRIVIWPPPPKPCARRHKPVLAARAAVGVVAAATGTASSFAAFHAGQATLAGKSTRAGISDPWALRSMIGAGLYLAVLGLFATGL